MRTGKVSTGRITGPRIKERVPVNDLYGFSICTKSPSSSNWYCSVYPKVQPWHFRAEKIVYENSNKKQFCNCDHSKLEFQCSGPTHWEVSGSSITNNVDHKMVGNAGYVDGACKVLDLQRRTISWKVSTTSFDIPALLVSAHNDMRPKIEAELSLINALLEVAEAKELIEGPIKLARFIARSPMRNWSLKRILKSLADASLWTGFGLIPTVADIKALYNVLSSVQSIVDDLWSKQGQVLTRYWSSPIPDANYAPGEVTSFCDMNWKTLANRSEVCHQKFTVTMKYTMEFRDEAGNPLSKEALYGQVLLDMLGVNWNPKIAWDAIPFSFLLDWVVRVGDWLSSFTRRNFEPTVTVLDCCYSIKQQRNGRIYAATYLVKNGVVGGLRERSSSVYEQKTYTRRRYVPSPQLLHGTPLPAIGSSSWRKWWLAVSLIVSYRG